MREPPNVPSDQNGVLPFLVESAHDQKSVENVIGQYSGKTRLFTLFNEAIRVVATTEEVINLTKAFAKKYDFAFPAACAELHKRGEVQAAEACEIEIKNLLAQKQGEVRSNITSSCAQFLVLFPHEQRSQKIKDFGGDDWGELQIDVAYTLLYDEKLEEALQLAEEALACWPNLEKRFSTFTKKYRVKRRERRSTPLPNDLQHAERVVATRAQEAHILAERGQITQTNVIWGELLMNHPAESAKAFLRFSKKYNTRENNPKASPLIKRALSLTAEGKIESMFETTVIEIGKKSLEASEWLQRAGTQFTQGNFQEGMNILEGMWGKSGLRPLCIGVVKDAVEMHGIQLLHQLPINQSMVDIFFGVIVDYEEEYSQDCAALCTKIAKAFPRAKHVCAEKLLDMGRATEGLLLLLPTTVP